MWSAAEVGKTTLRVNGNFGFFGNGVAVIIHFA